MHCSWRILLPHHLMTLHELPLLVADAEQVAARGQARQRQSRFQCAFPLYHLRQAGQLTPRHIQQPDAERNPLWAAHAEVQDILRRIGVNLIGDSRLLIPDLNHHHQPSHCHAYRHALSQSRCVSTRPSQKTPCHVSRSTQALTLA